MPRSMALSTASNSLALPIVDPSSEACRKKRRGMPISAFTPDVEPHVTMRPPSASERIDSAIVAGPTCSNTTSTPSPVACISAELLRAFALGLGAARREYARAEMASDLDGGDGHACARANHKHCLVGLEIGARGEHPPRGEKRERERGRLVPA